MSHDSEGKKARRWDMSFRTGQDVVNAEWVKVTWDSADIADLVACMLVLKNLH